MGQLSDKCRPFYPSNMSMTYLFDDNKICVFKYKDLMYSFTISIWKKNTASVHQNIVYDAYVILICICIFELPYVYFPISYTIIK